MTGDAFLSRWLPAVPAARRDAFIIEVGAVIRDEQARERRRLATDASYYRRSVDLTMSELREQRGVTA